MSHEQRWTMSRENSFHRPNPRFRVTAEGLSVSELEKRRDDQVYIDDQCDKYEKGWSSDRKAGTLPPRIEDYLAGVRPDLYSDLLRELLCCELDWRREAKETPRLEDYLGRFPHARAILDEFFSTSCGT